MNYTSIELNGYNRFALNEITHFKMSIHSALQLIIGTNGCGKSSLMEQLSPLPANPAHFDKAGSVKKVFEHRGKHYEISSVFQPKPFHSFKIDGVEHNEGGTITTHLGKCKTELGYTPEIHNLLLGREKFSQMSPPRRKEWFLKLCDTNYDYAIWLWSRAKELQRDTSGALKLAKKTLVQESEKLIGDDVLKALKAEADNLHQVLNVLLEFRKPVEADLDLLDLDQQRLSRTLQTLAQNLQDLHETAEHRLMSLSDYDALINQAQDEVTRTTALLDKLTAEFASNAEKIALLQKAEAKSIELLSAEIDELLTQVTQKLERSLIARWAPMGLESPRQAQAAFQTLRLALNDIFTEIPDNSQRLYSSQQLEEAKTKCEQLRHQRKVVVEHMERTATALRHMEAHRDHPDLTCPKCHHKFSAQYEEKTYNSLKKDQAERDQILQELEKRLSETERYIGTCQQYAAAYRQYMQLTNGATLLVPYWSLWQEQDLVRSHARTGLQALLAVQSDLETQIELETLQAQIKDKQELKKALQSIGSVSLQTLLVQQKEQEAQIETLTATLQKATAAKTFHQQQQLRLRQYLELRGKIQALIQQKRALNRETLETIRRQELNDFIRALQSALAAREQQIGTARQQKSIVENLSKRIDEYVLQEKHAEILVRELSPTEGLIAEGLMGFIKNYVQQMNVLIDSIWSYPLEVLSCETIEGVTVDLDYLFPLKVHTQGNVRKDVKEGSDGMIEVVDLAFRMTAQQYLNLQDAPLYLDEMGKTLDPAHKAETVAMIKALLEQNTFPQVFMISHDFIQYGALSNCDICLINNLNVAAPEHARVNHHVEMS